MLCQGLVVLAVLLAYVALEPDRADLSLVARIVMSLDESRVPKLFWAKLASVHSIGDTIRCLVKKLIVAILVKVERR